MEILSQETFDRVYFMTDIIDVVFPSQVLVNSYPYKYFAEVT